MRKTQCHKQGQGDNNDLDNLRICEMQSASFLSLTCQLPHSLPETTFVVLSALKGIHIVPESLVQTSHGSISTTNLVALEWKALRHPRTCQGTVCQPCLKLIVSISICLFWASVWPTWWTPFYTVSPCFTAACSKPTSPQHLAQDFAPSLKTLARLSTKAMERTCQHVLDAYTHLLPPT